MRGYGKRWGWLVLWLAGAAHALPVSLLTQQQVPYAMQQADGRQEGLAVAVVQCAFNRLGLGSRIRFIAWRRAQQRVAAGEADGYFPASRNAQRDVTEQWFGPVAPQQWRWYLRRDSRVDPQASGFREHARVGAYAGSNMLAWLQTQHYQVTVSPPEHDQMLDVLLAGRADAVLAANLAMDSLIAQRGAASRVRSTLAQDKPLGLYLSRAYLARQAPGFALQLQQALQQCRPLNPR